MQEAYRRERLYWNNIANINKPGIKTYAEDNIIAAAFEFTLFDSTAKPRNIFVAANSYLESTMFIENDSKKGINILTGEKNLLFKIIINNILTQAGDLAYNMESFKRVPRTPGLGFVNFFAIGQKERFYKNLTYEEIHYTAHPYYPFYTYIWQLVNELQKIKMYESLKIKPPTYEPIIIEN